MVFNKKAKTIVILTAFSVTLIVLVIVLIVVFKRRNRLASRQRKA